MYLCMYDFWGVWLFLVSDQTLKKQKTEMFEESLFILKNQDLISFSFIVHAWINKALINVYTIGFIHNNIDTDDC